VFATIVRASAEVFPSTEIPNILNVFGAV